MKKILIMMMLLLVAAVGCKEEKKVILKYGEEKVYEAEYLVGKELARKQAEAYFEREITEEESLNKIAIDNMSRVKYTLKRNETLNFEITKEDKEKVEAAVDRLINEPNKVRAKHILILNAEGAKETLGILRSNDEAKEEIAKLLERAKDGEDFAELAMRYSEDQGSKDIGGEYTFGRGRMVPEFEETTFNLNVGEISDVVETSYGYHIIKLEEKMEYFIETFDGEIESDELEKVLRKTFEELLIAGKVYEDEIEKIEITDEASKDYIKYGLEERKKWLTDDQLKEMGLTREATTEEIEEEFLKLKEEMKENESLVLEVRNFIYFKTVQSWALENLTVVEENLKIANQENEEESAEEHAAEEVEESK